MIIPGRTTWRGSSVPSAVVDDEHAHLLEGRSIWGKSGYPAVSIGRRGVRLHRYLWEQVHGTCPPLLDHINGDKWDNRMSNLRPATKSLNGLNRRVRKGGDLPAGVHYDPRGVAKPYYSLLTHAGRRKRLGYFATPDEASAAYEKARGEAMAKEASRAPETTT
jgi:hypothetical protein